ncbi:hypothetical protein R1sor_008065 [Riccia sorocarpa]|uniref:Uncharacterized protein n=1 Tax=Riccia sorocarpa TaxID=122646 RepID=A0ABD3HYK8_9MARC
MPKRFIRGDVINMYIKEKFLVQPRSELEGKFFGIHFGLQSLMHLTSRFANVGNVDSFMLIFGMYMDPKGWTAKNLKRRVLP